MLETIGIKLNTDIKKMAMPIAATVCHASYSRGFPKARRRGGAPRYSTQLTYLNKLTHRHRMRAPDMQAWPFYARACDREAYRNLRMRAIAQR